MKIGLFSAIWKLNPAVVWIFNMAASSLEITQPNIFKVCSRLKTFSYTSRGHQTPNTEPETALCGLQVNVKTWRPFQLVCFNFPNTDYVILSRKFAFCLFINYAYKLFHKLCKLFIYKWIGRHLKETVLWSTITWSEMGKHNVQGIS